MPIFEGLRRSPEANSRVQINTQDLFYPGGEKHLGQRITYTIATRQGFEGAARLTQFTEEEIRKYQEMISSYTAGVSADQMQNLSSTANVVMMRGWHSADLRFLPDDVGMQKVQRAEVYTSESDTIFKKTVTCVFDFADEDKHFPDDLSYILSVMGVPKQNLKFKGKEEVQPGEYTITNGVKYTVTFGNGKSYDVISLPLYRSDLSRHPRYKLAVLLLIKQGFLPLDAKGMPIHILS